jgi:aspartyl-tRNA synthetase
MTYAEAMRRYGSDKPDLRFEMELQDLIRKLNNGFRAVCRNGFGKRRRNQMRSSSKAKPIIRAKLDELQEFVKRYGARALAWIKIGDETTSSLLKVLGEGKSNSLANCAKPKKAMRF